MHTCSRGQTHTLTGIPSGTRPELSVSRSHLLLSRGLPPPVVPPSALRPPRTREGRSPVPRPPLRPGPRKFLQLRAPSPCGLCTFSARHGGRCLVKLQHSQRAVLFLLVLQCPLRTNRPSGNTGHRDFPLRSSAHETPRLRLPSARPGFRPPRTLPTRRPRPRPSWAPRPGQPRRWHLIYRYHGCRALSRCCFQQTTFLPHEQRTRWHSPTAWPVCPHSPNEEENAPSQLAEGPRSPKGWSGPQQASHGPRGRHSRPTAPFALPGACACSP